MVRKYVLEAIPAEDLEVFVIWGPMLGRETEADAKPATAFLPDPRVQHFWTPSHEMAEVMGRSIGLVDERGWDVFLLHARGVRWETTAPVPSYYMHVGRSLPQERRFNAKTLAEELERLLRPAP